MGVGKSIELMNNSITMKKIVQNIASSMMIFALVISAFNMPLVSIAHAQETNTFSLPGLDLPGFDFPDFDFGGGNLTMLTCRITADNTEIFVGGNVTLSWDIPGAQTVTINGQPVQGDSGSIEMTNIQSNTTYTVSASANGSSCNASVRIICLPAPVDCRLEVTKVVDKTTARVNDTLTYTITVKNTGTTDCTGSGVKIEDVLSDKLTYLTQSTSFNITPGYDGGIPVYTTGDRTLHFNGNILNPGEQGTMTVQARVNTPASCGDYEIPNQARATAFEMNNFGTWASSQTVRTTVDNDCVTNDPAPSCDAFTATPSTIVVGGNASLAWQTTNASRVVINNGVGEVAADGNVSVAPLTTTTYQLTAFGTQNRTVTCDVPVTVSSDPVPVCEFFTATPNTLGSNGGSVTLNWKVNGASAVSIAPSIGSVATQGSQATNVTANTNFVLTATDADGDQVTCAAPVTLATSQVFSCPNNVSFTASDYSIREGEDITLNWSTANVDSLTISGVNSTALSGSTTVGPRSNTTYTLTATKNGQSINCPISIAVDEDNGGGGGGGSSSPRCELTISDSKIKRGDQITLKWDTSRATKVEIEDDNGKTIMSTDKYSSKEKDEYYDGSIKLKPTKDTTYTLVASKGSKDRTCKVKVDVDDLVVLTDRDQKPLVAGISLSNVPYTGFEAGPVLTVFFYTLLAAWALFVSYLIISRRQPVAEFMATTSSPAMNSMKRAEDIRPDAFVASMTAPVASVATPVNLPTGTPVIGYENVMNVSDDLVTALENRAHEQNALLSSDAIRHFISTTEGSLERNDALDEVIAEAKGNYPLEDGWVVINESRMRNLCDVCIVNQTASATAPFVPALVPEGSSSLAEAIVTGNIVAAYEMIGNRPMFALADAAADLDAVVRNRRGESNAISNLLSSETAKLSEEKIKNMITALTGALDGTYTDEASAVKMAIMKAVKEVA
jgi:uncharacterized repeat protein (TIGR01451 family)